MESESNGDGTGGGSCCQRPSPGRLSLLCVLCAYCALQSCVANGLVPSVLSTIERRFGLETTHLAVIMAAYDAAYILLVAPVSYFGGRHRKPLFLAAGLACIGVGSLTFSLPYFLTLSEDSVAPLAGQEKETLCPFSGSGIAPSAIAAAEDRAYIGLLLVFVLAHALHGAGAAPLFTVGVSYLHENVSKKMSSVYIGTFYSFVIFGPALGFVASSVFLQLPANFWLPLNTYTGHATVGAWYPGFLIASFTAFLFVPVLAAFPATLKTPETEANATITTYASANGTTEHHSLTPETTHPSPPPSPPPAEASVGSKSASPELVLARAVDTMHRQSSDKRVQKSDSVVRHGRATTRRQSSVVQELRQDLKHVPLAVVRLFTNPIFLLVSVAACGQGLLITGISTFMAKYIEKQFSVPAARSSLLIGCGTGTSMDGLGGSTWVY